MKTADSAAPPSRLSSPRAGGIVVAAIAFILVASLLAPRIPQDQGYHGFADQRTWLGVPNGADVLPTWPLRLSALSVWEASSRVVARASTRRPKPGCG